MSLAFRLRTTYCVTSHLSSQRSSPHTLAGVLEIMSAEEYEEDLLIVGYAVGYAVAVVCNGTLYPQ